MKNITFILAFSIYVSAFSNDAETLLFVVGKDAPGYIVKVDDEEISKNFAQGAVIKLSIKEPKRLLLKNYQTGDYIFFFLDMGNHEVTINVDSSVIRSATSLLNSTYNEFWQLKKKYDLLIEHARDTLANPGFPGDWRDEVERLRKEYHWKYYEKCMIYPSSFVALKFLNSLTGSYLDVGIEKSKLFDLFAKLDSVLFNYPLYEEVKFNLEYLKNLEEPQLNLNQPLWPAGK